MGSIYLTLQLIHCVAWRKSVHHSVTQFPQLCKRNKDTDLPHRGVGKLKFMHGKGRIFKATGGISMPNSDQKLGIHVPYKALKTPPRVLGDLQMRGAREGQSISIVSASLGGGGAQLIRLTSILSGFV